MDAMVLASATTTATEVVRKFSFDDVLSPYIYVFYAAFVISFLFTPLMKAVASYYGVVDKPDGLRKIHREPVAYLGGIAVFLGWLAGLAVSRFLTLHGTSESVSPHPHIAFPVVLAAIVIVIAGLIDDIRGIKPWVKIGAQVAAAGLLLWGGVGINVMRPVIGSVDERIQLLVNHVRVEHLVFIPELTVYILGVGLTVALVVFCCNAANLMDGMDGLCGGVTAIISLGYVFLALHIATIASEAGPNMDAVRVIIALALMGAVLGFVPYNFNPASIFMGDAGSMFLGFVAATLMLMMGEVATKWLLASIVMFALPILDTALAFVRRYVNNRPFFSADKHHIHHQFLNRGLTVKQTVLFLYASATVFVLLGSAIAVTRTRYAVAIYLVLFGSIVVAAFKMGMVHEKTKVLDRPKPIGPGDTLSAGSAGTIEIREFRLPPDSPAQPC
jgi:UDP-GlcNAc:undecaprenyl-phosphate GlcNAc-1-phosphate transferase